MTPLLAPDELDVGTRTVALVRAQLGVLRSLLEPHAASLPPLIAWLASATAKVDTLEDALADRLVERSAAWWGFGFSDAFAAEPSFTLEHARTILAEIEVLEEPLSELASQLSERRSEQLRLRGAVNDVIVDFSNLQRRLLERFPSLEPEAEETDPASAAELAAAIDRWSTETRAILANCVRLAESFGSEAEAESLRAALERPLACMMAVVRPTAPVLAERRRLVCSEELARRLSPLVERVAGPVPELVSIARRLQPPSDATVVLFGMFSGSFSDAVARPLWSAYPELAPEEWRLLER